MESDPGVFTELIKGFGERQGAPSWAGGVTGEAEPGAAGFPARSSRRLPGTWRDSGRGHSGLRPLPSPGRPRFRRDPESHPTRAGDPACPSRRRIRRPVTCSIAMSPRSAPAPLSASLALAPASRPPSRRVPTGAPRCASQAARPAGAAGVCLLEGGVPEAPAAPEPEVSVVPSRTPECAPAWDRRAAPPGLLPAGLWLPARRVPRARAPDRRPHARLAVSSWPGAPSATRNSQRAALLIPVLFLSLCS